ncbi:hypothetical protein [Actinokineospora enzanensis]|uniref:hypothetical protein n=1 Tax=Actinokineospora enzanensis TaxID=155975 RepID=UPI000477535D|nr:hypothetical protein [Actinokineospora enzanensis]
MHGIRILVATGALVASTVALAPTAAADPVCGMHVRTMMGYVLVQYRNCEPVTVGWREHAPTAPCIEIPPGEDRIIAVFMLGYPEPSLEACTPQGQTA